MKKFKQLVLLFITASVTLVSCDKDDDNDSASIEGSWEYSKEGTIINGQEFLVDYDHTAGCNKDYTQIIAGGTLKDYYYESDGAGGCDEFIDTLNWTRNGNTITITSSGFSTSGEIVELTNTTLKTKYTDPDDGSIFITVFTRR